MYRIWIQMCVLLGGGYVVLPGLLQVNGIEIFTSSEVEAVNGTNVRLKCTFKSKLPISSNTVTVSWTFHPLAPGPEESVYYYQETAYPPTGGRFKDHAVWSGDIAKQDASITLHQVPPTFNGTYICQVQNKPDVHGKNGEIVLKVVNKVALSDLGILAAAVGGACGLILIVLGIFVWVKYYRKRPSSDADVEMHAREQEWKDPTVCNLEEAIHLKTVEKAIEVDSSDGESEASSGDDEEEGDGGEEEDDDDDDDDGGEDDGD